MSFKLRNQLMLMFLNPDVKMIELEEQTRNFSEAFNFSSCIQALSLKICLASSLF